jgi:hypothetical protein
MPTYIRKTIKLLPWVNLNISKTGPSLSIGPRGAKLNISRKGVYVNSSIRGTGVYNKTKLSTSLVWALAVAAVVIGIGYYLGIALHNFNLFVGICVAGVILGIVTFFVARNIKHAPAEEDDDIEEAPTRKKTTSTKSKSTKTTRKGGTNTGERRTERTDKASAKAYISEVESLMDKMADANTVEELEQAHSEILDIMYTNIKPLGVKVLGMEFKDAMAAIERDYAEGLRQLNGSE